MKRPIAIVIDDLLAWANEKSSPDQEVIATVWSRQDFPAEWDALMGIWTRADSERLIAAGREVIEQVIKTRITQ